MLRIVAITTLILAAGLGTAQADIWRWKDAQGVYHYSDQWVPGSELIKANKVRPAGSEADKPAPTATSTTPTSTSSPPPAEAAARAVKADVAKAREQQCKDAKDRYDKAIHARRIFKADEKGERQYMSDADADSVRLQARTDMELACAPGK
jgi:hypothetical protein